MESIVFTQKTEVSGSLLSLPEFLCMLLNNEGGDLCPLE